MNGKNLNCEATRIQKKTHVPDEVWVFTHWIYK